MKKSKNIETQKFIDNIEVLDNVKYQILIKLREIVLDYYPEVKEKIMYGGIIFSLDDDWGGIFVYKNHISFEFSFGHKLNDPKKILEGNGKYRRHIKIKSMDEIKSKNIDFFVKQIKEIAN